MPGCLPYHWWMPARPIVNMAITAALMAMCGCPPGPAPVLCPNDTVESWLTCTPAPSTRLELLQVPVDLQRGVFASLPAELRREMWVDKLRQVRDSGLLDDAGLELLAELEPLLMPTLWSGDDAAADAALQAWISNARSTFDEPTLGLIGLTLADFTGVPGDLSTIVMPSCSPSSTSDDRCSCSTKDDWCAWPAPKTIHCEATSCAPWVGCGWFWRATCDGHCTGLGPG